MNPTDDPWWSSSLGRGAPGLLLAHAARAHTGDEPWEVAHGWAKAMVSAPVPAGNRCGLFHGAPAVAFALHTADHPGYAPALAAVHEATLDLVERRLIHANARIDAGTLPELREYDLISGLTGLGVYLLTVCPDHQLLPQVLSYLVRFTHPVATQDGLLPGWWTAHGPSDHPDPAYPRGHGNFGLAHGISGPLALVATSYLGGVHVPGQQQAMERILTWLDSWNQNTARPWWPEWVSTPNAGSRPRQGRPSWCYGAPGIAWAQHLAGRALADRGRQLQAEHALLGAADPAQRNRLTEAGLCHGRAGLRLVLARAAEHALLRQLRDPPPLRSEPAEALPPGLLEGRAGLDLTRTGSATWANCLLLGPTSIPPRRPVPAS